MRDKAGAPSAAQRAAQLELKLENLSRDCEKIQQEESIKVNEMEDLRVKVDRLKRESKDIKD